MRDMKYLGIDYGMRKTGIALSDESGAMGFPHSVMPTDGRLVDWALMLIKKEGVGAIVIGESKDYSGNDNPVAAHAREFAEELKERSGLPLYYAPEVLTTEEARRMPDGTRVSGGTVDASAAALILTHYLESL